MHVCKAELLLLLKPGKLCNLRALFGHSLVCMFTPSSALNIAAGQRGPHVCLQWVVSEAQKPWCPIPLPLLYAPNSWCIIMGLSLKAAYIIRMSIRSTCSLITYHYKSLIPIRSAGIFSVSPGEWRSMCLKFQIKKHLFSYFNPPLAP